MAIQTVGAGSYDTAIPASTTDTPNQPVTDFQGQPVAPLVTDAYSGAVPTNDWASSLAYPFFDDPYSALLYAHPLTLKAEAGGLQLGHAETPRYIDGGPGDPASESVKYEYPHLADLHVGLDGLASPDARLDSAGDWSVTAAWRDADSGLKATFGHGMPFTYFRREGDADAVIRLEERNDGGVGVPDRPLVYEIDGLNGAFDGGATRFRLPVDAGSSIANGPQVRVSYDFDGDGTYERIETFNYFPTDAADGWETYTDGQGLWSGSGDFRDFADGSVKVEVWNAIGDGYPSVRTDAPDGDPLQARLELPFDGLTADGADASTLYLRGGAEAGGAAGALSTQAGAAASVDSLEPPEGGLPGWSGPGTLWHADGGVLGITVNGTHYGIFGPSDATWTFTEEGVRSDLAGNDYFSVAVLPDDDPATLEAFRAHAYAFVTDTTAGMGYDPATGTVTQTFDAAVETMESGAGLADTPLLALYRHQWLGTDSDLTDYGYASPRGEMKVLAGDGFSVDYAASPLLPTLPLVDGAAAGMLYTLVDDAMRELESRPDPFPQPDTYWAGKEMGRLSELAQIAQQVGHTEARDAFLGAVKAELEDWLTAGDGSPKGFAYNAEWQTFQGYPASFGSDGQLNDHHFHYGYFVQAAATVAQFDPAWAAEDAWGGMVDLIIRDVADTSEDGMFPLLRNFDPYAGHSWAAGHGAFASGNNQESSSEALNFAASLARWGAATGQTDLRDLGLSLHAIEAKAVEQYWFDVDDAVFPDAFPYNAVGMVWGDGSDHRTFFSAEPEMIRGINFLPITGGSLHLGRFADYVVQNYDQMVALNGGNPTVWKDVLFEYLALGDPARALALYEASPGFAPEDGESVAHTYHWLHNMARLGRLVPEVTADQPFAAVFEGESGRSYVVHNPGAEEVTVTFSDGTVVTVAAGSLVSDDGAGHQVATAFGPGAEAGTDGADMPTGGDGSDTLTGGEGDDTIGGGDDTPTGGEGSDTLSGGDGTDTVTGGEGDDTVPGTAIDRLYLHADGRLSGDGPGSGNAAVLDPAPAGGSVGTPDHPTTWQIDDLSGTYAGGGTGFVLPLDTGANVGNGTQARISVDFDGDGTFDRVETWHYFATDDLPGWEAYTESRGLERVDGSAWRDLDGGSVRLEVWNAIGDDPVALGSNAFDHAGTPAGLDLPYADLVAGGGGGPGSGDAGGGEDTTPAETGGGGDAEIGDTLYLHGDGTLAGDGPGSGNAAILAPAPAGGSVGTPADPLTWRIEGVSGSHDGGGTAFVLPLDTGHNVANGTQARVSVDFEGDGVVDRVETFRYFATNDLPGWESYTEAQGLESVEGAAWRDLDGGAVTLEVWNAIGDDPVALGFNAFDHASAPAQLRLPYDTLLV